MKRKQSKPTVKLPQNDQWRDAFKTYNVRVGLNLQLSRAMLEMLSAIADDVHWDRSSFGGLHRPDNFMATTGSLKKRGLIEWGGDEHYGSEEEVKLRSQQLWAAKGPWKLTPAGQHVVALLKSVGLFIEADMAEVRRQILKRG